MKALYCQACGDIIAPYPAHQRTATGKMPPPRTCLCGRHAVWWTYEGPGYLRVWDRERLVRDGDKWVCPDDWKPAAFIIGMTNMVLLDKRDMLERSDYETICDAHDDYYLFKRKRQWAIRIRPGHTSDTSYASAEQYLDTSPLVVITRDANGPLREPIRSQDCFDRNHEGLARLVMDPHQGKQPWMGQDVAFLADILDHKEKPQ